MGRGFPAAQRWLGSLAEVPSIPNIAHMEVVRGCQNKAELYRQQNLFALYPVVWMTEQDCHLALALLTQFRLSHGLGLEDALIAATALGQGATLCTFNVKHFAAVPGLVTE